MFTINLLFTLAWVAITGELTIANFIVGYLLSFGLLYLTRSAVDSTQGDVYFQKVFATVDLALYFTWSIIVANARMVRAVLLPTDRLQPAIIRIPLDIKRQSAITFLANWITLTPGTLSLDVSDEFDALFVHTIDYGSDVDSFRDDIKQQFERRVQRFFA